MQAFEAPAKWFFGEFLPEGEAQEVKSDLAPLGVWANEMAQKKDVLAQVSLARACHVASAKFKRMRDEASAGSEAKESLGKTMKENEELKADISNKAQRIVEPSPPRGSSRPSGRSRARQARPHRRVQLQQAGGARGGRRARRRGRRQDGVRRGRRVQRRRQGPAADGPLAGSVSNASRGAAGHSGNPFEPTRSP